MQQRSELNLGPALNTTSVGGIDFDLYEVMHGFESI